MAGIFRKYKSTWLFFCGGSLINHHFVITAAHCLVDMMVKVKPEDVKVKLGSHEITNSGIFYNVTEVFVHIGYSSWKFSNDIALLKLKSRVKFNDEVSPICLPHPSLINIPDNTPVTVSGWGTTKFGGMSLLKAFIFSKDICIYNFFRFQGHRL